MEKLIVFSILNTGEVSSLTTGLLATGAPIAQSDNRFRELYSNVEEINDRLTQNLKYSAKSLLTETLSKLDKNRDQGFVCLRDQLQAISISLLPAKAALAKQLYAEFDKLGTSLYRLGYQVQSSLLNALFEAFDKAEAQQQLATLGLIDDYEALKSAENTFLAARKRRVAEQTSRSVENEPATEIAEELLPELSKMVTYVQLYAELEPETYEAAFQEMVTIINEVNRTARSRRTRQENEAGDQME